jgi:hypothetical protein
MVLLPVFPLVPLHAAGALLPDCTILLENMTMWRTPCAGLKTGKMLVMLGTSLLLVALALVPLHKRMNACRKMAGYQTRRQHELHV